MAKRNYERGADRGAKLAKDRPRGFAHGTYGAAGPVRHIDPAAVEISASPVEYDQKYAAYHREEIAAGRVPRSMDSWRDARRRRAKVDKTPEAVRRHQFKPYVPTTQPPRAYRREEQPVGRDNPDERPCEHCGRRRELIVIRTSTGDHTFCRRRHALWAGFSQEEITAR